ncbi:hypothetical protein CYMTET_9735 [Cymbomonas tetramitiformis]|uniref:Cyclin N-terminal domain-containing protein n=1 Tax=Cymbomonas tetramitiformis TaxID=36881 RepID=A0AAE0LEQ3_9CHLO|nr:hypothetical protein CYMTET_9735 [Cymbomonas tetramitiformis]
MKLFVPSSENGNVQNITANPFRPGASKENVAPANVLPTSEVSQRSEDNLMMDSPSCSDRDDGSALASLPDVALVAEICKNMRKKEVDWESWFDRSRAWYLSLRPQLVKWIIDVCESFSLRLTTASIATVYLDRVLMKQQIPETSTELVALACVLLAAKFEEEEINVPSITKLSKRSNHKFNKDFICRMEGAVLSELNWRMCVTTSAHFLETFLEVTQGGFSSEDSLETHRWSASTAIPYLLRYAAYFQSLALQEYDLWTYRPSCLAAGVLLASRVQLQIDPSWPEQLERATGYTEDEISTCAAMVLRLYMEHVREEESSKVSTPSKPLQEVTNAQGTPPAGKVFSASSKPSPKGPLEAGMDFDDGTQVFDFDLPLSI